MFEHGDEFEDLSEFTEDVENLLEKLRDSVNQETKSRISALELQCKEQAEKLLNLAELERAAGAAKRKYEFEVTRASADAKMQARKVRLDELLEDLETTLYQIDRKPVGRLKCDKCNDMRRIPYTTPLGREQLETCSCAQSDYVWQVVSVAAHSVAIRNGQKMIWWTANRKPDEYNEVNSRVLKTAEGAKLEKVLETPREYSFVTEEAAQKMIDLLNEKGVAA